MSSIFHSIIMSIFLSLIAQNGSAALNCEKLFVDVTIRADLIPLVKRVFDQAPNTWHHTGFKGPTSVESRPFMRGLSGYGGAEPGAINSGVNEATDWLAGFATTLERYAFIPEANANDYFKYLAMREYTNPLAVQGRTDNFWQGSFDFNGKLVMRPGHSIHNVEKIGIFTMSTLQIETASHALSQMRNINSIRHFLSWSKSYFELRQRVVLMGVQLSDHSKGAKFASELQQINDFILSNKSDSEEPQFHQTDEILQRLSQFLAKWDKAEAILQMGHAK